MRGVGNAKSKDLLIFALLMTISFLLLEVAARTYDLYLIMPTIDVPSHFLAGLALGSLAYWWLAKKGIKQKGTWAVFTAFVAAGLWEIIETTEEIFVYNPPYLRDFFFWDGFWDIIFTTLGGFIVMFYIYYLFEKKKKVTA